MYKQICILLYIFVVSLGNSFFRGVRIKPYCTFRLVTSWLFVTELRKFCLVIWNKFKCGCSCGNWQINVRGDDGGVDYNVVTTLNMMMAMMMNNGMMAMMMVMEESGLEHLEWLANSIIAKDPSWQFRGNVVNTPNRKGWTSILNRRSTLVNSGIRYAVV